MLADLHEEGKGKLAVAAVEQPVVVETGKEEGGGGEGVRGGGEFRGKLYQRGQERGRLRARSVGGSGWEWDDDDGPCDCDFD